MQQQTTVPNNVVPVQNPIAMDPEKFVLDELTGNLIPDPAVTASAPLSEVVNQVQETQQIAQLNSTVDSNKIADILEDDEDEDVESLLKRIPENSKQLEEFTIGCQGCLLLLMLKQHLKDSYGITDT